MHIATPTLLIHGTEDPRPIAGVEELAAIIPGARLAALPGAGHQPWHERPEQLRRLLTEFIAERESDCG